MGLRVGASDFLKELSAPAAGTAVKGRAAAGAAAAPPAGQPHLARVALGYEGLSGVLPELLLSALLEESCAHGVKKPCLWSPLLLHVRRKQQQSSRARTHAATMAPTTPAQQQAAPLRYVPFIGKDQAGF